MTATTIVKEFMKVEQILDKCADRSEEEEEALRDAISIVAWYFRGVDDKAEYEEALKVCRKYGITKHNAQVWMENDLI